MRVYIRHSEPVSGYSERDIGTHLDDDLLVFLASLAGKTTIDDVAKLVRDGLDVVVRGAPRKLRSTEGCANVPSRPDLDHNTARDSETVSMSCSAACCVVSAISDGFGKVRVSPHRPDGPMTATVACLAIPAR